MRILLLAPLALLAACQVTEENNGATTLELNQDVAEEGARDVANEAGAIAGKIGNEVGEAADKVGNEVGDVDVDVDLDKDRITNAN